MNYEEIKAIVGAIIRRGGFPPDEPLNSVKAIAEDQEGDISANEMCTYSWVFASFEEWDRAEAIARSIIGDDEERGQALATLAQRLATAGLLNKAERVVLSIDDSPNLTGVMVEKATALTAIAAKFAHEAKPDRAASLLAEAELTAKQRPHEDHLQATLLGEIARTLVTIGQKKRALELWDEGIDVARASIQTYRSGGSPVKKERT